MKIRQGFVSNSSSSSFVIKNYSYKEVVSGVIGELNHHKLDPDFTKYMTVCDCGETIEIDSVTDNSIPTEISHYLEYHFEAEYTFGG